MKLIKTLALGALVSVGLIGAASAQTTIYITGSTAFRSATYSSIMKVLGSVNGTSLPAGSKYGYTGGSLSGARCATFYGTYSGNSVIVKTSFSGSSGGIQTTAGGLQVKFLPASVDASLTQNGVSGLTDPTGTGNPNELAVPNVTMMDSVQSITPFNKTYLGVTYAALKATQVGVVPFKWFLSKNGPAGLTNITPLLAQALWTNGTGTLPLALFTGNSADQGTLIYATGRDPDSGTRTIAFAESGIGVNTTVKQFDPSSGALYPKSTINGIVYDVGNGGESSGGTLAGKLAAPIAGKSFIGYVGFSDWSAAVNGGAGATELSWNGVSYTKQNVIEGKYTYWAYENLGYLTTYTGVGKQFADALAAQIQTDSSLPIQLSEMHVDRPTDAGLITPNY
jgi:hypothetical protein